VEGGKLEMLKGDISNKFAPAIVLDIKLIFEKDTDGLVNKVKNILGVPRYKLRDKRIPRHLEQIFYSNFSIYLLNRSQENLCKHARNLLDTMCFTSYSEESRLEEIQSIIDQRHVVLAVFDRDFPASRIAGGKAVNFVDWHSVLRGIYE